MPQSRVFAGEALLTVERPRLFEVADLAHEFADALALPVDLIVGGLERRLGVESALAPTGIHLCSTRFGVFRHLSAAIGS